MNEAPPPPVRTLSQVLAGAPADRPVYILDEVPVWGTFRPPGGPHAGHTIVLRKVGDGELARRGVVECIRCRHRWSFVEYRAPETDPYRPRILDPGRGIDEML